MVPETRQVCVGGWQAEGFENLKAEPFVLAAFAQINVTVLEKTNRQFEDVAGGRRTQRKLPLILVPQQCGFLLSAGQ